MKLPDIIKQQEEAFDKEFYHNKGDQICCKEHKSIASINEVRNFLRFSTKSLLRGVEEEIEGKKSGYVQRGSTQYEKGYYEGFDNLKKSVIAIIREVTDSK